MHFEIKNQWKGSVIYQGEAGSLSALVQAAVKSGAYLRSAYLHGADLHGADLQRADLRSANLQGANLQGADLYGANLQGAYLRSAYLHGADLHGADLQRADLRSADLRGAKNIPEYVNAVTMIVPQSGSFEAWKKCENSILVRVLIPAKARRSNATGRKCRAEYVKVLEVIGADEAISTYDNKTVYRKGRVVKADTWNEDRWTECGGGIHFFLTRHEAETY